MHICWLRYLFIYLLLSSGWFLLAPLFQLPATVTIWFEQIQYCHVYGVTIDRYWMDDQIYWTLWYSMWLQFIVCCYTHTLMSTVTSSLPLFGSSFQWRMFPFLWVPKLSLASATSFPQQQLTMTEPQQLSDWLLLTGPAYNISAQTS
jgi:hypothetical protein